MIEKAELRDRVRKLWEGWKRVAARVADLQARLLLTALYFLMIAPTALFLRFVRDPLQIKPGRDETSRWVALEARGRDLDEGRRQW